MNDHELGRYCNNKYSTYRNNFYDCFVNASKNDDNVEKYKRGFPDIRWKTLNLTFFRSSIKD